jgi:hypothetical protein
MGRKKKNITFKLGPIQYRRVGPVKLLQVGRLEIWNIAGKIRAAWIDSRPCKIYQTRRNVKVGP